MSIDMNNLEHLSPLEKTYRQMSDEELIIIATVDRETYNEDALRIADAEIRRRNLNIEKVEEISHEETEKREEISKLANEPLEKNLRLACMIFWFIYPTIYKLTTLNRKYDVYKRKKSEVNKYTIYGIVLYAGLFGVLFIILEMFY